MRLWLAGAALAAGAGLLAAAFLHERPARLPAVPEIQARGTLGPVSHRFGEAVSGQVDVLVPRGVADASTVRLEPRFEPYELAGAPRREQRAGAATTLVRFRFALDCLRSACLPRNAEGGLLLPDGEVRYRGADGRPGMLRISWPPLMPVTNLAPEQELFAWRSGLERLPPLSFRLPPRLLASLLAVLAALCAAGGLTLLLPRGGALLRRRRRDRRSLLEQALALVRHAASGADPKERRRALDLLARSLRGASRAREAGAARRLAWSRLEPGRREMEALADSVEGATR